MNASPPASSASSASFQAGVPLLWDGADSAAPTTASGVGSGGGMTAGATSD